MAGSCPGRWELGKPNNHFMKVMFLKVLLCCKGRQFFWSFKDIPRTPSGPVLEQITLRSGFYGLARASPTSP